jgi:hypothetical protein
MPLRAPVRKDFRLVHEPIDKDDDRPLLREEADIVKRLADKLLHSSGGTFLITGFRGVGKTTVVRQALRIGVKQSGRDVLEITVPLARDVTTTELLFNVMRRLFERLRDTGQLRNLAPELTQELLTAYRRTSFAISASRSLTRSADTELAVGGNHLSVGKAKLPLPGITHRRSRTETEATAISFLTYSETDVEHDFLQVIDLLGRPGGTKKRRTRTLLGSIWPGLKPKPFPQLVIVFDEIDKLTAEEKSGLQVFNGILGGLKNVLAASGVHFVLVAGVDLHDEWLRESAMANSLYRSVFAWQGYVGCSWEAAGAMLDGALEGASEADTRVLTSYLAFRGRGVIRNILYELNELIEWDSGRPEIKIEGIAEERVRLLAEIFDALQGAFEGPEGSVLSMPSDRDRVKQVAFFTADWVLKTGRDSFTVADVLDPARGTPVDLMLRPTPELVRRSLLALNSASLLEREARNPERETQGPAAERYPERFRLSANLVDRLELIARSSPQARAEFGQSARLTVDPDLGWDWATGEPEQRVQEIVGGEYEILGLLGRGGFGTVWLGAERETGKKVAIKIVRTLNEELRRRAIREVELLDRMEGDGVVRLLAAIHTEEQTAIVTEYVNGTDLASAGWVLPEVGVKLSIEILETVERLHANGIIHADLKPSNILIYGQKPVVVDLGTAEWISEVEPDLSVRDEGTIRIPAGTPAYMAPELHLGGAPSEASDVWAVALLTLEILAGELPPDRNHPALVDALERLPISSPLRASLAKALDPDPKSRPSAAEFRRELADTPEGRSPSLTGD